MTTVPDNGRPSWPFTSDGAMDDAIDAWHALAPSAPCDLHEWLGMSLDVYRAWVCWPGVRTLAQEHANQASALVRARQKIDAALIDAAYATDRLRAFCELAAMNHAALDTAAKLYLESKLAEGGKAEGEVATHWGALALARDLARTLGDAPNYVTIAMDSPAGDIEVTVRRDGGVAPATVISELRAEVDRLNGIIAAGLACP